VAYFIHSTSWSMVIWKFQIMEQFCSRSRLKSDRIIRATFHLSGVEKQSEGVRFCHVVKNTLLQRLFLFGDLAHWVYTLIAGPYCTNRLKNSIRIWTNKGIWQINYFHVLLASDIDKITKNYRLGFGAFIDKPTQPFIFYPE